MMGREHCELIRRAAVLLAAGLATILASILPSAAAAASFTTKDLQILGRAIGFMQPAPGSDGFIAIVYMAGNAASRQDADATMAQARL